MGGPWLRLTDDQRDQLVANYEAGATIAQLADRLAATPRQIRRALLNAGCVLRPTGPRPTTRGHESEIRAQYEAGSTLDELATTYGATPRTIRAAITLAGGQIRRTGQRRPIAGLERAVARDYEGGMTQEAVAAKYETNRDLVRVVLREQGVPIRRP